MPQILLQTAWQSVKTLLMIQMGLMTSMAVLCGIVSGEKAVYSAFLAGLCCIVATIVFAVIAFGKRGAKMAPSIMRAFYRAEAVKWLVTAVLMMCVFTFVPIHAAAFFATFCVMQLSYFAVLGLFKN